MIDCGEAGRVVHCKREPYDILLNGKKDPRGLCKRGLLGNPYTHLPVLKTNATYQVSTILESIQYFDSYARERAKTDKTFRNAIIACYGKTVACWCAPKPCHGVVVLRLAAEFLGKSFVEPMFSMSVVRRLEIQDPEQESFQ